MYAVEQALKQGHYADALVALQKLSPDILQSEAAEHSRLKVCKLLDRVVKIPKTPPEQFAM